MLYNIEYCSNKSHSILQLNMYINIYYMSISAGRFFRIVNAIHTYICIQSQGQPDIRNVKSAGK